MSASQTAAAPHPLRTLLGRYGAVLRAAWRQRHELAGPARQADEAAFLPAALSLQETPPHPAPRRVAWALCGLFVLAVAWACIGQVDIVAVAPGRIMVTEGTKQIQPLEPGVVQAIKVRDGDHVEAGQVLIELDATAPQADVVRLSEELAAALSEALRTRALLESLASGAAPTLPTFHDVVGEAAPNLPAGAAARTPPHLNEVQAQKAQSQLEAEWADWQAQRARLEAEAARKEAESATMAQQLAKVQATLPLARQREADILALSQQGFMAGHAGQDRTRERIEMERDLATLVAKQREAQASLRETRQQAKAWLTDARRQLQERSAKAELSVAQLQEEAGKAAQKQRLATLTSPVAGTAQQLAIHTTGGVVTPAQVLLVVVPDDIEVVAEVLFENRDIGFVKAGQYAEIKLEAFPYIRWGTVPAMVTKVNADAILDEKRGAVFAATLKLKQSEFSSDKSRLKVGPGMALTAEVSTGSRHIMEYFASPIFDRIRRSIRER